MKNILSILQIIIKRNIFFLIFILTLIFIGSLIELISMGSIIPGIQLLFDGDQKYIAIIKNFFSDFNIETNSNDFIVFYFGFLVFIFLIKNIFLIFINWVTLWYVGNLRLFITKEYYNKILSKNYEFHLKKNSSKFIRDIIGEINAVSKNIIFPILTTVLDIFTLTGIIIFSSLINLKITLITFFLILASSLIFSSIFKNKFKKYGKFRHQKEALKLKNLVETLRSIKIVIFEGKKNFFLNNFMNEDKFTLKASIINSTVLNSIRYFFETLLIIVLFFIILSSYLSQTDMQDTIIIITFLTVAFLRIFPSLNKFTVLLNNLNFYKETIKHIAEILNDNSAEEKQDHDKTPIKFNNSLEFRGIDFSYDNSKKIFNNFNFEIKKNNFVVISGKNGSGKSTLISIFLGLLQLQKGEILVDKKKINTNSKIWRSLISFVPQENLLFDTTIKKNIIFTDKEDNNVDEKQMKYALDIVGLTDFINNLPKKIDTQIGESGALLSGGQRQKLIIARALYKKSEILVFDEPTSSFDNESKLVFTDLMLKLKNKYTILIVSHSDIVNSKADKIIKLGVNEI